MGPADSATSKGAGAVCTCSETPLAEKRGGREGATKYAKRQKRAVSPTLRLCVGGQVLFPRPSQATPVDPNFLCKSGEGDEPSLYHHHHPPPETLHAGEKVATVAAAGTKQREKALVGMSGCLPVHRPRTLPAPLPVTVPPRRQSRHRSVVEPASGRCHVCG